MVGSAAPGLPGTVISTKFAIKDEIYSYASSLISKHLKVFRIDWGSIWVYMYFKFTIIISAWWQQDLTTQFTHWWQCEKTFTLQNIRRISIHILAAVEAEGLKTIDRGNIIDQADITDVQHSLQVLRDGCLQSFKSVAVCQPQDL